MLPLERQQKISDILSENGIVQVSRLAEEFGVSELTIRRDLDQMEAEGLLKRTHGGATILRNMNAEPHYLQKAAMFAEEKHRIAEKAAELVQDDDIVGRTVFLYGIFLGQQEIRRQRQQVEHFKKLESRLIPDDIDYHKVGSLRIEALQKLERFRPHSLGQASRIAGVSPADIAMLNVWLEQRRRESKA